MKANAKKTANHRNRDQGSLEQMLKELSPELRQEVIDFAKFLLEKKGKQKRGKLRLDWAGALSEYRDQFTSLELQRKGQEWRIEHATRRH